MPEADPSSPSIDPPLIPLGLTPSEVASEFGADMAELTTAPALSIEVTEIDCRWPFAQGVRDDGDRPLVLVQPALVPTVSALANIAARLVDRAQVGRFEEAKVQLHTFLFDRRASDVALSEREHQFARAMGHGMLRFLVGDACIATLFRATSDDERAFTLADGRSVRPLPSRWLRDPKWMDMLATFVGHKAQEDTLAPLSSAARAGVSLFLLNAMHWEYQALAPGPRFLSEELMEETWCCRAVETWRSAATDPDGKDHSGYGWAMDVSFAKARQ